MSAASPAIGFDVGGQSTKAVLVSAAGEVLARASAPTGEATGIDELGASFAAMREGLERTAGARAATVGVGIAGVLDRSGALRGSPHLPRLVGVPIGEALAARLGAEPAVRNDADCAAVAEGWGGAADGILDYLMIAIGTGVGSGLVLGGRLRAGESGFGCEFGHMLIAWGGRTCGCGNLGCVEAYVSETAAAGLVADASAGLRERVAARRRDGGGFAEALFRLGESGDAEAEAIAGSMVDALGVAIASAVNVLDLTTIVLGGGIAPGVLSRVDRLRAAAARSLFARGIEDLRLVAATRGPLAGAIGAARIGMLAR